MSEPRNRWRSRPLLSFVLIGASVVLPLAASVATAVAVGRAVPRGTNLTSHVLWWAAVLGASTVIFIGFGRIARRLLPLAALLKMTMLFPDHAPRRLKVAWRAGSIRALERNVEGGIGAVPNESASEILALAASLSRHDRATRGHSERVRAFTDLIADELQLPAVDRDRLRWSALLHDVGKLGVHPHTLNKPGTLNEDEWAEIRNHPLEGRRLIAPLAPWLGEWSLVIEQHHEWYDGSGYPFGLSGDQLSLGARIVAVADCFEVMTAFRSYKKPMGVTAARQELTRCAGTQFDPAIVRAFLNVSLGQLRWATSPLSWIADIPFVARLGLVGHAVTTAGQAVIGAATVTLGGALALHAAANVTPPTHNSPSSDRTVAAGHLGTPTSTGSNTSVTSPPRRSHETRRRAPAHASPKRADNLRRKTPPATSPTSRSRPPANSTPPHRSASSATPTTAPAGTTTTTTAPSSPTTTTVGSPGVTTTTKPPPPTTTTKPPTPTTTTTTPPATTTTAPPPPTTTTQPRICLLGLICL